MISTERALAEKTLQGDSFDFSNKFLAARNFHRLVQAGATTVAPATVDILEGVLRDRGLGRERQSLQLFREAALSLMALLSANFEEEIGDHLVSTLARVLTGATGNSLTALAEAAATLPLGIARPEWPAELPFGDIPQVDWDQLPDRAGFDTLSLPCFAGRSLVAAGSEQERILVVKLARAGESPEDLQREAAWMDYLASAFPDLPHRFDVPSPLRFPGNSYLFRLSTLPVEPPLDTVLHPDRYAIGFVAHQQYFDYPNHGDTRCDQERFEEILLRNSWLLGRLASEGIIHEAPIPLFHNRVQQGRRTDAGLYQWPRRGRLDRWLESCAHPNIGPTGIRDFEHFFTVNGSGDQLYLLIGNHLLSLILVTASYFRNRDESRIGLDRTGQPVDARDLFDPLALARLIDSIFQHYYSGIVGRELDGPLPVAGDALAERLINEMGVDRYMEEFFRVADQEVMSDHLFARFLEWHGFSRRRIRTMRKGEQDIRLFTGPHLGGFNQRISCPELIDAVAAMSACCLIGRYLHVNGRGWQGEPPR